MDDAKGINVRAVKRFNPKDPKVGMLEVQIWPMPSADMHELSLKIREFVGKFYNLGEVVDLKGKGDPRGH